MNTRTPPMLPDEVRKAFELEKKASPENQTQMLLMRMVLNNVVIPPAPITAHLSENSRG